MFKMLIDTCVWLDLAKDQRQVPLLAVVEEMVKIGMVTLIVPGQKDTGSKDTGSDLIIEFTRHLLRR